MPRIALPEPLEEAEFLERPDRFSLQARVGGERVRAWLPDPGRLTGLLLPGGRLYLHHDPRPGRRTAWTALALETPGGEVLCLDTRVPNRLAQAALEAGALTEFRGWRLLRPEARWGRSRFDFLLGRGSRRLWLEVKGVTHREGRRALFPDAVSARAARHLRELARLKEGGEGEAAVLFLCQRRGVRSVGPARALDPDFARAWEEAQAAGVRFLARRVRWRRGTMSLGPTLAVEHPGSDNRKGPRTDR